MHRRVLVVTTELLPPFTDPCAGGGVRAWALGQALAACGHDVEYAIPAALLQGRSTPPELTVVPYEFWTLNETIQRVVPDLLLFEQWFPLSYLQPVEIPVVVDLPGPLLLENWYRGVGSVGGNAMVKLRALAKADFFLHATERQRPYWTAWLLAAGVAPDENRLLHVPIQLSPKRPLSRPAPDELVAVYAGLFWAWQDPSFALRTVVECMDDRDRGRCVVIGGRHPQHTIEGERYTELPEELLASTRITVHAPVPFAELVDGLSQCHLAIDTSPPNAERELSSNIRTVVYLWAGLPVIVSDHSYLAEAVREYQAGWVVPGWGGDLLRQILFHVLDHPQDLAQRAAGARRLAEERLTWATTPPALLKFVSEPTVRTRHPSLLQSSVERLAEMDRELEAQRQRNARLDAERFAILEQLHDIRHELGAIRGRLLFRLDARLRRLLGKPNEIPPRPKGDLSQ